MNWEAIGAFSEALGALAVVAALLFVVREFRQNSRALKLAALRDTTAQWNHWSDMLASSADLAEIVARGNRSLAGLGEAEALRYGAYVQAFFDNAESYRNLVTDIEIERSLAVLETIVARRIGIPGFAEWWRENTDDYDGEFVAWVEEVRRKA